MTAKVHMTIGWNHGIPCVVCGAHWAAKSKVLTAPEWQGVTCAKCIAIHTRVGGRGGSNE